MEYVSEEACAQASLIPLGKELLQHAPVLQDCSNPQFERPAALQPAEDLAHEAPLQRLRNAARVHVRRLLPEQARAFCSWLVWMRKTSWMVPSSELEMLAETTFRSRLLSAPVSRSSRLCWSGPVMVTT